MPDRKPDRRDPLYQHLLRYGFSSPEDQWRFATAPAHEFNSLPPAAIMPPLPDVPGLTAEQIHQARDAYSLDGEGRERPVDWNGKK